MARAYRVISSDSHLEIGPDRWRGRVPAKYRDRAPQLIHLPDGGDGILAEGRPMLKVWAHNVGIPYEEWGMDHPKHIEGAVGAGDPEQRLREMDQDGVDAEVQYPGVSGLNLLSGISDNEAYWAIVAAYNEFVAEEYMAADPERLFPVGVIPKRGVDAALRELEHCQQLGLKSVGLDAFPNGSTRPKPEDDRFWSAALEMGMPITIHTSFSEMREGRERGGGLDLARRISTYGTKAAPIAAAMAIHGVFDRNPKLEIFFAENQIGWLPCYLEQMDLIWERHRFYHERAQGLAPLEQSPSELVKQHCLWGFMDDRIGVLLRHEIGVDRVMWSTDFPHDPSDWPNSRQTIEREFAGVPEDERHQMLAGNAIRFFNLDALLPSGFPSSARVAQTV
jgi:predicted TIM-barrel fold metal-dependent hydrolase